MRNLLIIVFILIGTSIIYFLLFMPLYPEKNRFHQELPKNIPDNAGKIHIIKPNSHKISGYQLERARILLNKLGVDISKYRITNYHKINSLDSDNENIGADYVINGLPLVAEGIYAFFEIDNKNNKGRIQPYDDFDPNTKNDPDRLKATLNTTPTITPIEAFETAKQYEDPTCKFTDMFKNANENQIQMELVYYAKKCYTCQDSNFNNFPYKLHLAWIINYLGGSETEIAIDAHTGEIIYGNSGILDCNGL